MRETGFGWSSFVVVSSLPLLFCLNKERIIRFFFLKKKKREDEDSLSRSITHGSRERERERETRVCVCVYDARVDEMMIFFEDRAREYNLVRRLLKKIDPLGLLLFLLLFLSFPFLGGEFFFSFAKKGELETGICIFFTKKNK